VVLGGGLLPCSPSTSAILQADSVLCDVSLPPLFDLHDVTLTLQGQHAVGGIHVLVERLWRHDDHALLGRVTGTAALLVLDGAFSLFELEQPAASAPAPMSVTPPATTVTSHVLRP
jgi:acyl transferase domain-containing protein